MCPDYIFNVATPWSEGGGGKSASQHEINQHKKYRSWRHELKPIYMSYPTEYRRTVGPGNISSNQPTGHNP